LLDFFENSTLAGMIHFGYTDHESPKMTNNQKGCNAMLAEERRETIMKMLTEVDVCPVTELLERLGVSRITVVRDLAFLEKKGLLIRVHGGARLRKEENPRYEARFKVRMSMNLERKQAIASEAAGLVKDSSTIFLDSSTTCYAFALELMKQRNRFLRLNVITNSPAILTTGREKTNIAIIGTGGELNTVFNMFGGLWVADFLEKVNIDSAFISASGISKDLNLTTSSIDIANILRKVLEKSGQTTMLADSSKLAKQEMLNIFPLSRCSLLVTDDGITPEQEARFRDVVEVRVAGNG
jgi:DeoR family lactose phosphotransferase system repressor